MDSTAARDVSQHDVGGGSCFWLLAVDHVRVLGVEGFDKKPPGRFVKVLPFLLELHVRRNY